MSAVVEYRLTAGTSNGSICASGHLCRGLRNIDAPKRERRGRVNEILPRIRLVGLAGRYPRELSGDPQQRYGYCFLPLERCGTVAERLQSYWKISRGGHGLPDLLVCVFRVATNTAVAAAQIRGSIARLLLCRNVGGSTPWTRGQARSGMPPRYNALVSACRSLAAGISCVMVA